MTPKQVAFVQHYCSNGQNATQAAISAGYAESGAHVEGARLLKNAKVISEIDKQRAKTAERCEISVETLTRELEADRELARTIEQPSAAVAATNAIAKLHGLLTEDRKNTRQPLSEVLERINGETDGRPRLHAVK